MDEKTQQERWIAAARRHHGPSAAAVQRMQRGLRGRIEAGEAAPAWEVSAGEATDGGGARAGSRRRGRGSRIEAPAEARREPRPAERWRPWIIGTGVLVAAAAVLVWLGRGSQREIARRSDPNAAELDAAPRQGARATARAGGHAVEPSASVSPPSIDLLDVGSDVRDPVAERSSTSREHVRPSSTSGRSATASPVVEPSSSSSTAAIESPAASETAGPGSAALDVAGEAAVLRRAKAAIEREAWSEASAALDAYEREHPSGVLAPEAAALRVLVACGRGSIVASTRAEAFVKQSPSSPLRERIGRACAIDSTP